MSKSYITKNRFIALATIITILLLKYDITFKSNTEDYLKHKYKEHYAEIVDYTVIDVFGLKLIDNYMVKPYNVKSDFTGNNKDKVRQMISYINKFNYNINQHEPVLLETKGGNCQAKTLYFKKCLDNNDIPNTIMFAKNHMYNRVKINGNYLDIDLIKGTIKGGNLNE
ncbi:hypothetical protein [Paraclostridium bifermentans]|uniref:hypothetical protein n=1 Tax=Paraclostridium bifermentans TaxID=1490 RepID=UPI00374FC0A3